MSPRARKPARATAPAGGGGRGNPRRAKRQRRRSCHAEVTPEERERIIYETFVAFTAIPENREILEQEYLDPVRVKNFAEGYEEGRQIGQVKALLSLLRSRRIRLSKRHVQRLQGMSHSELPCVDVALGAADAKDFVRSANLDDGRLSG